MVAPARERPPAQLFEAGQERRRVNGDWYREVVQRREGLRFHHAGRRGRGPLLPPQRDPDRWLPLPAGRAEGRVRRRPWPQGPAGAERPPHRLGRAVRNRTWPNLLSRLG